MPEFQSLKPLWQTNVEEYVTALAWSPTGEMLAVAPAEGSVQLLSANKGEILRSVKGHGFGTMAMSWSPRGYFLATGGQEKLARIWDARSGDQVAELEGGGGSVEHLAWSPAGDMLATVSGKHIKLWDATGALLEHFPQQAYTIAGLQWRADGKYLATISFDGIRLWERGKSWPMLSYEAQMSLISLAWSRDFETIICGTQDATLLIWNTKTGDDFQAGPYPVKVKEIAWDHTSRFLASGAGEEIALWDFNVSDKQGLRPRFFAGHKSLVTKVTYQNVGPMFASGGRDGAIYFWKPEVTEKPVAMGEWKTEVSQLGWHRKDNSVAAGYVNGDVVVWPAPGRR